MPLNKKVFIVSVEELEHSGTNIVPNRYNYKVCENDEDALSYVNHFENKDDKRVELTYSSKLKKYVGQCIKDNIVTDYYVNIQECEVSGPRKSHKESCKII